MMGRIANIESGYQALSGLTYPTCYTSKFNQIEKEITT